MCMRPIILVWATTLVGCDVPAPVVPAPDYDEFVERVYPLLLRDCGFNACHGDQDRFYQIFGPGRRRLSPDSELFDDATSEEIEASYERARAMLSNDGD